MEDPRFVSTFDNITFNLVSLFFILMGLRAFNRNFKLYRFSECFPGAKCAFAVGNYFQYKLNPVDFLEKLTSDWKEYGCDKFRTWFGQHCFIVLTKPEEVKIVLSQSRSLEKLSVTQFLTPWLGNGLFSSSGPKQQQLRQLLATAYHTDALNCNHQYSTIINRTSTTLCSTLSAGNAMDLHKSIKQCTLDVLWEIAHGSPINTLQHQNQEVYEAIETLCSLITKRMYSPWKRNNLLWKLSGDFRRQNACLAILNKFHSEAISKCKQVEQDESQQLSVLDKLWAVAEKGKIITHDQVQSELSTFVFGGYETVSSALTFALHELASQPLEQDKIFLELRQIMGADIRRNLTHEDLDRLPYLDMVIKEVLRMYPSVPFIGRQVGQDGISLSGLYIPPSANVLVFLYGMGRNPNVYENPDTFNPQRFASQNPHLSENMPFGYGPRHCAGRQMALDIMKTVLAKTILQFRFTPADLSHEVVLSGSITLKPGNDVQLKTSAR